MTTRGKLVLLGSLYLSQGLPFGFLTQAVPVLLREAGASLTTIGDTSLLMLPWLLKALWAPLVDRTGSERFGRRRSWIVPLQLLTATVLIGLALAEPEDAIPWLLGATFLTALLGSTQDIATDGLAVEVLSDADRGLGNGVQVAGYRLGMVVGGGALLVVFAKVGWMASFLAMAGVLLVATLPILRHDERPVPRDEGMAEPVWGLLRRPGMTAWLAFLVAYKIGEQLGGAVTKPMLVDRGLDLSAIGWLGALDSGTSLVGALVGGLLVGRLGDRRALVGFGLLQAIGVALWAVPALEFGGVGVLAAVKSLDGFVGSMATVALFTAMMRSCRDDSGGTDYTVQASVVLVAAFLGGALGGRAADALIGAMGTLESGYAAHFLGAAVLTVVGALLALRVDVPR